MVKPAARPIDIVNVPRDWRFWDKALLSFDKKSGELTPAKKQTFAMGFGLGFLRQPVQEFVERRAPMLQAPQVAQLSVNLAQLNGRLTDPLKHPLEYVHATPTQALQILTHELALLRAGRSQRNSEAPRMELDAQDVYAFDTQARRMITYDQAGLDVYCAELGRIAAYAVNLAQCIAPSREARRAVRDLLGALRGELTQLQADASKARAHRAHAAVFLAQLKTINAAAFVKAPNAPENEAARVTLVPLNDGHEVHAESMEDVQTLQEFATHMSTVANDAHMLLEGPINAQERKLNSAGEPVWTSTATRVEAAIGALEIVAREQRELGATSLKSARGRG